MEKSDDIVEDESISGKKSLREKLSSLSFGGKKAPKFMQYNIPSLPKFPIQSIFWKGGTFVAGGLFCYLIFNFISTNMEYATHATTQGKQAIISITTGEIQTRQEKKIAKKVENVESKDFMPLIGGKPKIVIVVSGLGLNKDVTDIAMSLPDEVTLSFSPYATELYLWTDDSKHSILLDIPMESADYPYTDSGDLAIFSTFDTDKNKTRMDKILNAAHKYSGIITPYGEKVTSSISVMQIVLNAAKEKDLILLYYPREGNILLKDDAESKQVKLLESSFVFPEDLSNTQLEAQLTNIEKEATERGYAVAVIPAYPIFMDGIKKWINQLAEKGFDVVPVKGMFSDNSQPNTTQETTQ